MRGSRRTKIGLLALVIGGIGALAAVASAARASPNGMGVKWIDDPLCATPIGADYAVLGTLVEASTDPKATPSYQEWIRQPKAAAALDRLAELADLDESIVLWRRDHIRQVVVLTLEPDTDPASTLAGLKAAVQDDLNVVVHPACYGTAHRKELVEVMRARAWHPDALATTVSWHVDLTGRVNIDLAPADLQKAEGLVAAFGDVVAVRAVESSLQGRMDDGSPHYGGAGIGTLNDHTCTAGFTMSKRGGKWMSTASHCVDQLSVYSGPKYFGVTHEHSQNPHDWWPTIDFQLIGSGVETYTNKIHVDPCCPSVRTVTSAADAKASDNICISGMVTKAKCSYELQDLGEGEYCTGFPEFECWDYDLLQAVHRLDVSTEIGDSGAPVYVRTASSTAKIVGSHFAETGDYPLSFKISVIESVTGANVTTTCCADDSW